MFPHRVAPRVEKLLCVLLPLFLFAACEKPEPEGRPKKEPAEISLPPQASAQAFQQIERDLARFDWGPAHDAECTGCQPPGVTIRSTGLTKDLTGNNGPANLRIVALIQNHSNQPVEHTYSHTTFKANTKYLMWVHSQKDKKAVWGFIELGPDYNPKPKALGLFENCVHTRRVPPSPTDDANFYDCDYAHTSSTWIKSAYASPPQPTATASISMAGWVACDPDCCTGTIKPTTYGAQ
jgi:hypothetical protein